ncbi:hypothetical protein GCM10023213_05970 [Prosthecobacter algae]|uniref:Knr4/Smi1-like domain-containing protein n=1 Tax=Prosthecobacter algae TaxID=1144682 RepID=A0ABP9NUE6_9BACT
MNVYSPGPITKPERITEFEKSIGLELPEDYRAFLIKHNGGCPCPSSFETESGIVVSVTRLLSLGAPLSFDRLETNYKSNAWSEGFVNGIIKIGYDPGGQELMMATSGTIKGSIYLIIDNDAHLAAKSFTEFMRRLEEQSGAEPNAYDQLLKRLQAR